VSCWRPPPATGQQVMVVVVGQVVALLQCALFTYQLGSLLSETQSFARRMSALERMDRKASVLPAVGDLTPKAGEFYLEGSPPPECPQDRSGPSPAPSSLPSPR
jgi:hypothetical protein